MGRRLNLNVNDTYPAIADYGIIGAMHTCALVSSAGSIDWLCVPSFDSPAVFGRMLDWRKGGYFKLAPRGVRSVERRYLPGTNVLETTFRTESGAAKLTDFMAVDTRINQVNLEGDHLRLPSGVSMVLSKKAEHLPPLEEMFNPLEARFQPKLVRILECTEGRVEFELVCSPRFDYGMVIPHTAIIDSEDEAANYAFARGGGTAISLYCSAPLHVSNHNFRSEGSLGSGEKLYSCVTHQPFFLPVAEEFDGQMIEHLLDETTRYWEEWSSRCTYEGEYKDDVVRSALALKVMTYEPTGALLAAATTSLPEEPAGERNWDYRFTWIRDATFSLAALNTLGYTDEARAFKRWLEWTAAYPEDLQIMYGLRGERWLTEVELPLEGYKWSTPVRIGNGAHSQFQLDIYGEILDSAYIYRHIVLDGTDPDYWEFLSDVVEFVIVNWRKPDAGLWESRGGYRHFVFSKVMCWVALDRGIKLAQELMSDPNGEKLYSTSDAKIQRWMKVREEIRQDVLLNGYDPNYRDGKGAFVQTYGSKTLDASTLMLPLVGFIEASDPRMRSTIEAIRRDLTSPQGFVYRYKGFDDGLEGGEGTFTICTLWLISNLIALGDTDDARSLFEVLRDHANDLGLLSEEINSETGEMLGNFPQAFSHLAFIDNAVKLCQVSASREEPEGVFASRQG